MFTNSSNVNRLQNAFQLCSCGDNLKIKQGEEILKELNTDISYPILLFDFMTSLNTNPEYLLRASVEFKHWFERYKKMDLYEQQYVQEIVYNIKQQIVKVMLQQGNAKIIEKLMESIINIAEKDFPDKWPNLVKELMQNIDLTLQQTKQNLIILKLFKQIIAKYEWSMRSDPLYEEIIQVCNDSHDIILQVTKNAIDYIQQVDAANNMQLLQVLKILKQLMCIFYFLNYQDLHPKFEDSLSTWMNILVQVLRLKINISLTQDNDFILFKCKGETLKCILLFATKYKDDILPIIYDFSGEVWSMCTITNQDQKFDKIVLNSLKYFKNLVLWSELKDFFEKNLLNLITTLIIPNLEISSNDLIMFQEEGDLFIQVFFEQSDLSSRKSANIDLLKTIAHSYNQQVALFIQQQLVAYKEELDKAQQFNQQKEILLINLVIDSTTSAYRPKDGISSLILPETLIQYLYENIIKKTLALVYDCIQANALDENKFQPLHLAFYLRFFFFCRNYINKGDILTLARIVSFLTKSQSRTLRDIAAYTVEMLLTLKTGDLKNFTNISPYFNQTNVEPTIQYILQDLYTCAKAQETNVYILRAVYATVEILQESVLKYQEPFCDLFKDQLQKILSQGYDFQKANLIFDGLGLLIVCVANKDMTKIQVVEQFIQPELNVIINKSMADLLTFVLQIYAIFIMGSQNQVSTNYQSIFNSLMNANNWQESNVSLLQAYAVYIEAYATKQPDVLLSQQVNIQNILQKILQINQDKIFFMLCDLILDTINLEGLRKSGFLNFIISNSLTHYQDLNKQQQPTEKSKKKGSKPQFVKDFMLLICKLVLTYGSTEVLKDFNSVAQNALQFYLTQEVSIIQLVQVRQDRKMIIIALTNLLLQCVSEFDGNTWGVLINAIIDNYIQRKKKKFPIQINFSIQQGGTTNMADSGFQKLNVLQKKKKNLVEDIPDEDKYFGQKFMEFYNNPQIKSSLDMTQILSSENQEVLTNIIQNALVQQQ